MEDQAKTTIKSEKFPPRVQSNIIALRDNRQLCDFTIEAGPKNFEVHKFWMAVHSDYFKAMFTNGSIESYENKVCLKNVSATAMEAILDFCYFSPIRLDNDNVQDILIAASLMQIDEIQNKCVEHIKSRVDISNCLGVLMVSDMCNLADLFSSTLKFCLDKFELIVEEKEFRDLSEILLAKIISHDQLNVDNEENVFKAVLEWCSYDTNLRISKLDNLMSHVRFSLIEPVRLISLSSNQIIQDSSKFRDFIDEAKNFLLLQNYPEHRSQMIGPRFQPRVSLRRQQRIYAVGGWTNEFKPIASVEKYDPYSDLWIEIKPMTRPRCGVGVTILANSLYAVGGHDGLSYLKSAERYDISKETWFEDVAQMKSERSSVGVVSLDGYIYAIGGQNSSSSSNIVERYDPRTNIWEERQSLGQKRLGAGVTVLNGLIYVVGGADQIALKSVECYNPAKDKWTFVTPMTTSRKHVGCTTCGGKIYAVGGRGNSSELNSAECYDPELNQWNLIPDMSEKRSGIGLVHLDGLLYAVGGHNGDVRLKLVETYDPITMKWIARSPMIHERLGGGLAVHSVVYSKINQTTQSLDENFKKIQIIR